ARLLQNMALGFPFLPDPGFLPFAQLHTQSLLSGRILRSAMLQQPPRHGFEHMKEGHLDIGCSAQERSDILDNAMGVLGFVDGQKNSHSGLLNRGQKMQRLILSSSEPADTRGWQDESKVKYQKLKRKNLKVGKAAGANLRNVGKTKPLGFCL